MTNKVNMGYSFVDKEREESERIQFKIYLVNRNEDKNTTYMPINDTI